MAQQNYDDVTTEGIKYAGSKKRLIPYILQIADLIDVDSVFDGFSGTTRVSQALKLSGYRVIANDCAIWSKVFGYCYLLNEKPKTYYRPLIENLNNVTPCSGWYTEHYGGDTDNGTSIAKDGKKKVWQKHVTKKLDAIRPRINEIASDPVEKSVLLTSLILALDKVDNTVGHHASYLKSWSKRSHKPLKLKVPQITQAERNHEVYSKDTIDLAPSVTADLAYYDPPYGSANEKMPPSRVRYSAYYHLWKTICLNDEPETFGAANRREDSRDQKAGSVFESYKRDDDGRFVVVNALERLLKHTDAKYTLLSYSNKGRATPDQIRGLLRELGFSYRVLEVSHEENVMKTMQSTGEWVHDNGKNIEFLFLISSDETKLPEIKNISL